MDKNYGAVPGPCIRLKCHIDACYGWDYCKEARDEASPLEWNSVWKKVFPESHSSKETTKMGVSE